MPVFEKLRLSCWKENESAWYLKIETSEELLKFAKQFIPSFTKIKAKNLLLQGKIFHGDAFDHAVDLTAQLKSINRFSALDNIINKVFMDRLNCIHENKIIFIGENGIGWFPGDKEYKFQICLESKEQESYIFPTRQQDIKYIQWPNGKHWYAKIGGMDVVDEDGNQKWNSKEKAKEAVDWYIKKYKIKFQ